MASNSIAFPEYLNRLAAAGADGLPIDDAGTLQEILSVCDLLGCQATAANGRIRLEFNDNALIPFWIEQEVDTKAWDQTRVLGFLEQGSTNAKATALAMAGAQQGTIVYAEYQAAGHGRFGRQWFSVPGASLCFSLVLRPRQPREHWPLLTHAAGVSLVRALQLLESEILQPGKLTMDLKWPNDVLISGKKVAGILLEVFHDFAGTSGVVLGVGINVGKRAVPNDLLEYATALESELRGRVSRRCLMVRFLNQFQDAYLALEGGESQLILSAWKQLSSMWNGAPVWIEESGRRKAATTCGISESGALIIRTTDGMEETIMAADIRIRRIGE